LSETAGGHDSKSSPVKVDMKRAWFSLSTSAGADANACLSTSEPSAVEVAIFNSQGQEVRRLARGERIAGAHALAWDGRNDAGSEAQSGVYFYRITAGDLTKSGQLVLAR
jgi:flagellar hook assembly protein FlgD